MKLDARLQAVADFVPMGSRVADIGTDHGYLAAELLRSGRAKYVIASDKNAGPYEAAVRTIREYGLTDEVVSVRQGDGLKSLSKKVLGGTGSRLAPIRARMSAA